MQKGDDPPGGVFFYLTADKDESFFKDVSPTGDFLIAQKVTKDAHKGRPLDMGSPLVYPLPLRQEIHKRLNYPGRQCSESIGATHPRWCASAVGNGVRPICTLRGAGTEERKPKRQSKSGSEAGSRHNASPLRRAGFAGTSGRTGKEIHRNHGFLCVFFAYFLSRYRK